MVLKFPWLFLLFAFAQSIGAANEQIPLTAATALKPIQNSLEHNSTNVSMLCYYCRHSNKAHKDLSDPLIERSECLSPELFANQSQFQRQCAPNEGFCMTSVSSMNGFFVEMRRDCAERCHAGCQENGYGLFRRQCARCCRSPLCNHFDGRTFLLNDESVQQMPEGFSFGGADEDAVDSLLEHRIEKGLEKGENGAQKMPTNPFGALLATFLEAILFVNIL